MNTNFVTYHQSKILYPCSEKTSNMKGEKVACYYCRSCTKNVFYFGGKTEEEFNQILAENE